MSSNESESAPGGTVVFLSGDLIFSSRVRAAAQRSGLDFKLTGALPEDGGESIRYVILDLSTRASLTAELAGKCAEHCPQATIIAYGPHVQVSRLAGAREAGIPRVLTRGQFDAKLSTLFEDTSDEF